MTDSLIVKLAKELRETRALIPTLTTARVTQLSPLSVDAGGESPILASRLGWWAPTVGQPVWVIIAAGRALVLGGVDLPILPMVGVIREAQDGIADIELASGASFRLRYANSVNAGDEAWVAWSPFRWGEGIIGGKMGAETAVEPPPPPPPPPPVVSEPEVDPVPRITQGVVTVRAIDVRTWRGNRWRTDTSKAYQGDWSGLGNNTGYWFYGNGFDVLRGAKVLKAEVFMRRLSGGAFAKTAPAFRIHGTRTRGSNKPALSGGFNGRALGINESGWHESSELAGAVNGFVSGGGGLAIEAQGRARYASFSGLSGDGKDSQTGAIRVTWQREN